MKTIALWLAISALCSQGVVAGDYYRLYWGGDDSACLYPSGTSSNTDWSITGAATVHEALDDKTTTPCYGLYYSDTETSIVTCAAATTTCTATLDLSDTPASGVVDVHSVAVWVVARAAVGGAKNLPQIDVYYRIASVDYLACNLSFGATNYGSASSPACGLTATNPATSAAWTKSDLDNLQIKIAKDNAAGTGQDLIVTAVGVGVGYTGGE